MFLYSPDTITGAGDESTLRRRIQEAINEANYLYTNSQINISINPVYLGKISYAESGDIQTDLQNMALGSGAFSGVSSQRSDYKADIVCLITEFENQGIGGLAWDIPGQRGNSSSAFLAIRRLALGVNLTLAHELGHLMGCAHDREHAGDPSDPFYLVRRSYIFGNRLQIQGVTYIDVMAYEPGVSLPYFANPLIQIDGVPLGVPEGQSLPSDTARTINETAPYVSAYRQALSRIEFASAQTETLKSAGSITLNLKRSGDLSGSTRVTVSIRSSSTAQAGQDYVAPSTTTIPFSAGQGTATFTLQLLARTTGVRALTLGLGSPQGSHGIGLQGETTVTLRDQMPVVKVDPIVARENSGSLSVSPVFTGPAVAELPKIPWHLASGSAMAGTDFQDARGNLKVQLVSGAYQIDPVQITILDNSLAEPDKHFQLIFDGTTHNGISYGAVTNDIQIVDDDRPGGLREVPGANLKPDAGFSVAVRYDHKLLVSGGFSQLSSVRRTGLALLNPDGTLDDSFRPPDLLAGHRDYPHFPTAYIGSVVPLPNGQFLIAGEFNRVDGKARNTLIRLQPDGSLDESFGANLNFDGSVDAVTVQPDGKILVGGGFENINGERRSFIARLNADGAVDTTFAPNGGPSSSWTVFILTIGLQADGKILIGGFFEQVDGQDSLNLARLNADGTIDSTFQMNNVSGPVRELAVQDDGRILLAGLFDTVGNWDSKKLARLNPDGSPDASFHPPQPNSDVTFVAPLPDGHILMSGVFTRVAGVDRRFLALLNSDGSLDPKFDLGSGPDDRLGSSSVHADGSLYVAGRLTKIDGLPAANLARLNFPEANSLVTGTQLSQGNLVVQAAAFPGVYAIEASTDLKAWTEIQSVTAAGFANSLSATIQPNAAKSFLRLRGK